MFYVIEIKKGWLEQQSPAFGIEKSPFSLNYVR